MENMYFKDVYIESAVRRGYASSLLERLLPIIHLEEKDIPLTDKEILEEYEKNDLSDEYMFSSFKDGKKIDYIIEKYSELPQNSTYKLKLTGEEAVTVNVDKNGLVNIYFGVNFHGCSGSAVRGPFLLKKGWLSDFSSSILFINNQLILDQNGFVSPSNADIFLHSGVGCSLLEAEYVGKEITKPSPTLDDQRSENSVAILIEDALKGDDYAQLELGKELISTNDEYEGIPKGVEYVYSAALNDNKDAQIYLTELLINNKDKLGIYVPWMSKEIYERISNGIYDDKTKELISENSFDIRQTFY